MEQEYIPAKKPLLNFYKDVPLYYRTEDKKFVLYKSSGKTLLDMRIDEGLYPEKLYIKQDDKIKGIQEVQKVFNQQLKIDIRSDNPEKVKETLVNIMEETFTEPKSGSLEGMSESVDIIVHEYTEHYDVMKNLLAVTSKDYTTAIHSINVMSLVLGYAFYVNFSLPQKKVLGLSALLHDVGKTKINSELLTMTEKLTEEEFKEMRRHTIEGYNILTHCKFKDKEIKYTALNHHEKLDGSGYPNGKKKLSETDQIVGLIDCYEALTNDDRPYRRAIDPFSALKLIKKDVEAGKFDRKIFGKFAYSLA
jgi:HD-GYP domain-containing protein (c-di-GMP phosphodiesterase class II)